MSNAQMPSKNYEGCTSPLMKKSVKHHLEKVKI